MRLNMGGGGVDMLGNEKRINCGALGLRSEDFLLHLFLPL